MLFKFYFYLLTIDNQLEASTLQALGQLCDSVERTPRVGLTLYTCYTNL